MVRLQILDVRSLQFNNSNKLLKTIIKNINIFVKVLSYNYNNKKFPRKITDFRVVRATLCHFKLQHISSSCIIFLKQHTLQCFIPHICS